jgi:ABC-type multidrug transport system permease subunit
MPKVRSAWLAGWVGLFAVSTVAWGLGWLTETVTVPLWGIFALTFVPTMEFVELIQTATDRAESRIQRNNE